MMMRSDFFLKKQILAISCSLSLGAGLSEAANATEAPQIDPSPTFVSVVLFEAAENFTSQFGHIDLRFSYGARPDDAKDVVVGFGPPTDYKSANPLPYFGIGQKLKLINWTQAFKQSYNEAAKVKMIGVHTITLDLSASERREIADEANRFLRGERTLNYHTIWRNCSSVVADILSEATDLSGGVMKFLPYKLEKKLRPHALMQSYLPSGRALKQTQLEAQSREIKRLFTSAEERKVFEEQLLSRHTEFRQMAIEKLYRKKASAKLLDALLETEMEDRQNLFKATSERRDSSALNLETELVLKRSERLESVEVVKSRLVVKTSVPNLGGRPSENRPARRTKMRRWELSELGLSPQAVSQGAWKADALELREEGQDVRLRIWAAPNLGMDPR